MRPRTHARPQARRRLVPLLLALTVTAGPISALEPPVPGVDPGLARHQAQFGEPRVIQVSPHVFVAHAYSMCNIVMVVGDRGVAIFDTGFHVEEGEAALEALRAHIDRPIAAVIYSHGHTDHTGGSRAFAPADAQPKIPVYAHANFSRYLGEMHASTRPVFRRRAVAQLGMILPVGETGTVGTGGGPAVRFAGTVSYAPPDHVVSDTATIDLGGVKIELFHAPGDLDDALAAWIPEDRVLLAGDTVVGTHTHPILSTPRHEKGRDARAYVSTLSRMRDFPTEVLVGGHGAPIVGPDAVADLLERTELVAQFMIDETLRMTRANLTGPEIAARLEIPASISGDQTFGNYYHRLEWIVRGIHAKEMGWYGGDALELVAHSPSESARRLVDALGGASPTLDRAEKALAAADPRWAAELATRVLSIDTENARATEIKAHALRAIAYQSDSANERNYLLTEASIMTGDIGWNVMARATMNRIKAALLGPEIPETALAAPSLTFIQNLGPQITAGSTGDERLLVEVQITDRNETHLLGLREGVMLLERPRSTKPDVILQLDHRTLVLASEGLESWSDLSSDGSIEIVRGSDAFERFAAAFGE